MDCDGSCMHACSVMSDFLWPQGLWPPGSSVHGVLQAGILEWVLPFPSPEDLPDSGIEPGSLALQQLL